MTSSPQLSSHLTLPERITAHDPILICEVGSTAHGIATGHDDLDVTAIVYDPWDSLHGLGSFGTSVYRTAAEREGRDDARSQPGDVDLVVHGLRKFVELCLKGNPSVQVLLFQMPLWVAPEMISPFNRLRLLTASQRVVKAHIGYINEQLARLQGRRGQKNVKRPELVEAYGYDTKYAGHIVRLAMQGLDYAYRGRIPVPLDLEQAEMIRAIRAGAWTLDEVERYAESAIKSLEEALNLNPLALPPRPDTAAASRWLQEVNTIRFLREA